jgi:hypothetical protein
MGPRTGLDDMEKRIFLTLLDSSSIYNTITNIKNTILNTEVKLVERKHFEALYFRIPFYRV